MLAAIADDQDEGTAIRISLFQDGPKSAGLLCSAQKTSSFDMSGQPFGH